MASSSAADNDLPTVISEQQRELMAAQTLESDLDLAFRLQLEEAVAASVVLSSAASSSSSSSSSSSPPPPPPPIAPETDVSVSFPSLQSAELSAFEQEIKDRALIETETRRIKEELKRRIHDQNVAREILIIPEDEWEEWGDSFEKPYGEGSSSGAVASDVVFRMYFKGLVSEERVKGKATVLSGIGVAICDPRDNLIFEVRKPLFGNGRSRHGAEARALIEGLNAALALDLKRITLFCDYHPLYKFVIGRWPAKQRKIAELVNEVFVLKKKFTYCNALLVARNDVKFAFKLAREAIISQVTRPDSFSQCGQDNNQEECVICLEDKNISQIFSVDPCLHRYCFSCMKQHVEVKLLHGIVPKCPQEGCKSELAVSNCSIFLTPKLIEMMAQRIKEASIPPSEKVYCPYPKCSALMSKGEILENAKDALGGEKRSEARKCLKCNGIFCIECKVPWHDKMTCQEYRRRHPLPPLEVLRLRHLAERNLWRQCVKCNHLIELSEGCYHMTCRCGYEFCYNCGAEWRNKTPTCHCPLWEEDYIWHDRDSDDDYYTDETDDEDDDDDGPYFAPRTYF
ncbi:uncharacterized protein LOC116201050 [Punica granatum]|uniref:Uncharacterized protein LOC116201050 n=2 Tax=Punica granatum TaxID=22663 RepID=A0A6P8D2Z1_PUNGR|nr:uncharacterized protein LOC116201050 [Punica granatum]PKI62571.1 hypothetical protein CRG98_016993 [Punica granatum]